jgi:ribosomal protein S14
MQRLYTAANLPEAHLVCGLLMAAGIEARVLNEYSPGAMGELPAASAYPEIWIDEDRDAPRARQIVDAYENEPVVRGVTRCGACGEENPRSFALCWHCQRPL